MKLATAAIVLGLALGPGCKSDDAKTRAKQRAGASDFWPEAPRPAPVAGAKRTLAYQPANFATYNISGKAGTDPGAEANIKVTIDLDIAFRPGKAPGTHEATMRRLLLDLDAQAESSRLEFDGSRLKVTAPPDATLVYERGDASAPFDVAALADTPVLAIEFMPDGRVVSRPTNDELEIGQSIDGALVLFPDLPAGEIAAGHAWKVLRTATLSNGIGSVDVTYTFVYAGDGPCPAAPGTCAHLTFTAASDRSPFTSQGHRGTVTYGFAGKVFLNDKGTIDESRVRMDIDVEIEGHKLPMGGVYIIKPA